MSITSWLVAPQCTPGAGVPAHCLSQGADERLRGRPRRAALLEKLVDVVELDAAAIGDRRRRVRRDDAGSRLGLRERALDLEHRLEPRPIGDGVEELLGDEERPERRHTSEERRLPLALEVDVEAQSAVLRLCDQGRPLGLGELREHRIRGVRLLLVREVEARHDPLQETAREDADHEVRRLRPAVGPGDGARLEGDELEPAVVRRSRPTEPDEALLERHVIPCVRRVRVPARGVRLPDLDHAVGHGVAGAVQELTADPDRTWIVRRRPPTP